MTFNQPRPGLLPVPETMTIVCLPVLVRDGASLLSALPKTHRDPRERERSRITVRHAEMHKNINVDRYCIAKTSITGVSTTTIITADPVHQPGIQIHPLSSCIPSPILQFIMSSRSRHALSSQRNKSTTGQFVSETILRPHPKHPSRSPVRRRPARSWWTIRWRWRSCCLANKHRQQKRKVTNDDKTMQSKDPVAQGRPA